MDVVDWSSVPHEDDEKTMNDLRGEIALMDDNNRLENERLSALLRGCGRGRGKSPEFEFAARTILATGCSERAARENLLVGARLFLPASKYEVFESDVPGEHWFRDQRKGLGYEAWLHSMLRVAKCDSILQWGFDETRYTRPPVPPYVAKQITSYTMRPLYPAPSMDGIPTLNQWVLVEEGMASPSIITIECCGLMVGSTSEEIADHIKASWATGVCLLRCMPQHFTLCMLLLNFLVL